MTFNDIMEQSKGKQDFRITCPFHVVRLPDGSLGKEKTPSCFLNKQKHVFICFGCGAKGSYIKLKSLLEGVTYEQAAFELYGNEIPEYLLNLVGSSEKTDNTCPFPETYLSPYEPTGPIESRGISDDAAKEYGLLRDSESNILIPLRDSKGCLRGIQRRLANPPEGRSKYDYIVETKRSRFLFGEHLYPEGDLILCEGALDAVRLYSVLGVQALAMNSSHISQRQVANLGSRDLKRIILWPDNDSTGEAASWVNYKRLKRLVKGEVYCVEYRGNHGKDPCELTDDELWCLWITKLWMPLIESPL